jgi:chromosomal replication initiator protein
VEQLVLQEFGLTRDSVQARKRSKSASLPRQVCMYLARKWTGMSAQEIGAYLGGRNHTTVLFAAKKIEKALGSDHHLASRVSRIERRLQTGKISD